MGITGNELYYHKNSCKQTHTSSISNNEQVKPKLCLNFRNKCKFALKQFIYVATFYFEKNGRLLMDDVI